MVTLPVSAMASRALTQRLTRIWSIWEGSILTGHRFFPGSQARSMSSPMSRRSILSMLSTVSLRSSTLGAMVCLRAKASSCRVRSAERWAAFWISLQSRMDGWLSSACSRISSEYPRITPSILLKSWATPPASRPTDSIFCAWTSCCCILSFSASYCLYSVMSLNSTVRTVLP